MRKIKGFIYDNKLVTAAAAIVVIVVILATVSAISDRLTNRGFENREQAREEKREDLNEQFNQKAAEYRAAIERISQLEHENEALKQSVDAARREAHAARAERDRIARSYEKKSDELNAITDHAELRRVNCERRARLGYPCVE